MFGRKENIGNWIQDHKEEIQNAIERHRQNIIRETGDSPVFDSSQRELSEMPLCGAVNDISAPPGFHVPVHGEAIIGTSFTNHAYFSDGNRIVDPTVGQFFVDEQSVKGSAIKALRGKAPDLFIPIGDEVYVLCGDRKEIEKKLGIIYK